MDANQLENRLFGNDHAWYSYPLSGSSTLLKTGYTRIILSTEAGFYSMNANSGLNK